jgi:hypothetical protein
VQNFVSDLLRSSTSIKETQRLADKLLRGQGTQDEESVQDFLKQNKACKNTGDRRKFNLKKTIHTPSLTAAALAYIETDFQIYLHQVLH